MIQPIILWTDALLFLLVFSLSAVLIVLCQDVQVRRTWAQVFHSHTGVVGGIVLAVYLLIGLLDSMHFQLPDPHQAGQYKSEVISIFDLLLATPKRQEEKTYSAPFAIQAYTKETLEDANGKQYRDYPRLKFGGAAVQSAGEHRQHLINIGVKAAASWLLFSLLLLFIMAYWRKTKILSIFNDQKQRYARSACFTLSLLLLVFMFIAFFMGQYHVFGTDKVGQDVLYQALKSIRTGLVIGTLTTLIMLPFAIFLGLVAGFFRGWVDDAIQYLYTTISSIPGVLLIAASVLVLQAYIASHPDAFSTLQERADMRLLFLCLILGITSWTGLCRLLRGEALKLSHVEYIQVSTALGVNRLKIIARHLLPNVMHLVLIAIVLDFSGLVLAEAVLSYIGIGVDPTMFSWGNMINAARLELSREPVVWWTLIAAFFFMFFLVLSANLFADAVRDAFDPRTRKLT